MITDIFELSRAKFRLSLMKIVTIGSITSISRYFSVNTDKIINLSCMLSTIN